MQSGGRSSAWWQQLSYLFGLQPKSSEDFGRYHLQVMEGSHQLWIMSKGSSAHQCVLGMSHISSFLLLLTLHLSTWPGGQEKPVSPQTAQMSVGDRRSYLCCTAVEKCKLTPKDCEPCLCVGAVAQQDIAETSAIDAQGLHLDPFICECCRWDPSPAAVRQLELLLWTSPWHGRTCSIFWGVDSPPTMLISLLGCYGDSQKL